VFFTYDVFGASQTSFDIASFVFHFAFASRYFQKQTNVIKRADTSKYIQGMDIPLSQRKFPVSRKYFIRE